MIAPLTAEAPAADLPVSDLYSYLRGRAAEAQTLCGGNRMSMKQTSLSILILISMATAVAPQSDDARYSYRVVGKVTFRKNQSRGGATVYVMGTRPIIGRIPWTHVAKDGTFSIEFADVPDDFRVCAHPGETSGLLPLARTPAQAKKMSIRLSCAGDFRLDANHREKRIELRLK